MVKQVLARTAARACARSSTQNAARLVTPAQRYISSTAARAVSSTPGRLDKNDPFHKSSSATLGQPGYKHEGSQSRTDDSIVVEYPEDGDFPPEPVVQGRGGPHMKRTLPQFSLEGRVAVVTGGARGLGLVMAQSLVTSGASVALVDLNGDEADASAKALMEQFKKENPKADAPTVTAHRTDVSDPKSVDATLADIVGKHGKIDHLVTSAGFTENYDAISYPYERMKKLWGVNVDGTYLFATGVAKHLMERKSKSGSMVFIGSMSGSIVNVPQPQAPYNAAKAAVRHLAASMAVEWAHANIRVNCISPGYMLTALTRKILDENAELNKTWTSLIPMGKMGRPEDLMGPVTFLLSDASLYVTGADLRVDGGYTCT